MRKMTCVGVVALVVALSIVLTSCLDDKDNFAQPNIPVSYVSLYNASPDAPALNIVVDNNQINSRPFRYSDYTGFLPFYTGDRKIQFGPFGASNVALDTTLHLADSTTYSIFVVNQYSKARVLVLHDTASAPASGKAKIRFVNLSPDAGELQVTDKEGTLINEPELFKHASAYQEVDAKSYDLNVTGGPATLNVPGINLNDGKFYTIIARGYKTPPAGNGNVLSVEVIRN